ncbi:unnamed protein product [Knipowitschia caucasica]|uniref:H15 domain-containing protein n=1 Tax=Knipowitschia caucasica TaxID=637954 RepID=A0AAV2M7F6_KNICA
MAPKKAAVVEAQPSSTDDQAPQDDNEKESDAAIVRPLHQRAPSTTAMVKEAIKALDSRKGVSSQAIQAYVQQHYPFVDPVRFKGLVRKALRKGLEDGTLVRPANSTAGTGATGRFKLAQKPKGSKVKTENADPNVPSATKAAGKEVLKAAGTEAKGDAKKRPAIKKKPKQDDKSSEEPKPEKKSKDDKVVSSKVVPPKKPKAAKERAESEEGEPVTTKPKGKKAVKEEKPEKAKPAQKGKGAPGKAQAAKSEAPTKAQGKRGKKASE